MIRVLGAAAVAVLLAVPAMAQEYRCKMAGLDTQTGWISEDIVFYIDTSGEIQVNDGIIQHFMKKPVKAKVSENTDARVVFKWNVDTTNNSGQRSRIAYRATFTPESKKLRVNAIPAGYGNTFFGNGTCAPT